MSDIIRTWPASCNVRQVHEMFRGEEFPGSYYFTLGRGKPKQQIERLWWTWRGRILGYFEIKQIQQNIGQFGHLHSISDGEAWTIRPDHWVAICHTACVPSPERIYMSGFRGFRYFDFESYRKTAESRMRL